jgi:predicted cation transporter
MNNSMLMIGLSLIFVVVLLGPFLNKKIESNLEAFLFAMGVISATFSGAWNYEIVHEGLIAPINITLAVLVAGVLFHYLRKYIDHAMRRVLITVPLAAIVCVEIIFLGLFSSLISAIIAALLLVEFITVLPLHRHAEINLTIIACFAIGLGAALTPLGEPLSTIVVSKLSGQPYHADFFYLARLLGLYVVPAVMILAIAGIFLVQEAPEDTEETLGAEEDGDELSDVFIRAGKVYIFVMALIFLGAEPGKQVLTMRLANIVGSRGQDWYLLTAGAFISMAVPLLVFFMLQRFFVRGLLAGSVKG